MHKGQTIGEFIIVLALIVTIGICVVGGCFNKHVIGNKQYFDFKQTFNVAYVTEGDKVVRYNIKAWKDYENSDSIQFITTDGRTFYTHLNRVMLSDR